MSRIFKSSYVKVGQKKEIGIENIHTVSLDIKVEDEEEKNNQEVNYEEIYNEKMKEIESLANEKMEDAQKQAQLIIRDAYEDAKEIHKNAKEDGFEKGKSEGYSEGYEVGKDEADQFIKEALDIKNEVIKTRKNIVEGLEKESIDLVIHTVEKILNKEVKDSYETIMGLIKAGLSKCAYTESLVLRVSIDDYDYVESAKDKILCLAENIDDIIIKQDPSLKKGSCIIDTVSGSIDSSIETQFNQIKSLFREILESE